MMGTAEDQPMFSPPPMPPIPDFLSHLPRAGGLVIPFTAPTHGKVRIARTDIDRVAQCAKQRRCMLCGDHIGRDELIALFYYESASVGDCSSDPWMHVGCAEYTAAACPFMAGRRTEVKGDDAVARFLNSHERTFRLAIAWKASCHVDQFDTWHFQARDVVEMRDLRAVHGG